MSSRTYPLCQKLSTAYTEETKKHSIYNITVTMATRKYNTPPGGHKQKYVYIGTNKLIPRQ
jgi:hypothetical protein